MYRAAHSSERPAITTKTSGSFHALLLLPPPHPPRYTTVKHMSQGGAQPLEASFPIGVGLVGRCISTGIPFQARHGGPPPPRLAPHRGRSGYHRNGVALAGPADFYGLLPGTPPAAAATAAPCATAAADNSCSGGAYMGAVGVRLSMSSEGWKSRRFGAGTGGDSGSGGGAGASAAGGGLTASSDRAAPPPPPAPLSASTAPLPPTSWSRRGLSSPAAAAAATASAVATAGSGSGSGGGGGTGGRGGGDSCGSGVGVRGGGWSRLAFFPADDDDESRSPSPVRFSASSFPRKPLWSESRSRSRSPPPLPSRPLGGGGEAGGREDIS